MRYSCTWSFQFGETRLFFPLKLSGLYRRVRPPLDGDHVFRSVFCSWFGVWGELLNRDRAAVLFSIRILGCGLGLFNREPRRSTMNLGIKPTTPIRILTPPKTKLQNSDLKTTTGRKTSCGPGCPRCSQKCFRSGTFCPSSNRSSPRLIASGLRRLTCLIPVRTRRLTESSAICTREGHHYSFSPSLLLPSLEFNDTNLCEP